MFYQGSTFSKVKDYEMITSNFVNQELAWQCKKKLGWFFFVQGIINFFKKSIIGGVSCTNRHLLVLDGHGSHVTLETIEQAPKFEFQMITLPSYTSHAL
jgi:hypothetical protein